MKKVSLIILSLSIGVVGIVYYQWQQFTNLPEWYTQQAQASPNLINFKNPEEVKEAKTQLEGKIDAYLVSKESQPVLEEPKNDSPFNTQPIVGSANAAAGKTFDPDSVAINLDATEFNTLVVSNLVENARSSPLLESAEGFKTTIKNGAIEAGVVLNISQIPTDQLAAGERTAFNKAIQTFPFMENRQVYLALEGKPSLEQGTLKFDDNTKVKVGNLSMTLSELSQKLGIPQEQLNQKINLELSLGRLKINDIKFEGDRALIRGAVQENL
ncbi:hypothetical protein [Microcoleus sp. FACHB-672]|uniref:hypothetical protein n=1 Tax=Microcoleus sp. FACHB-672 TaxID=2692825 RepID=UPI00168759A7|nr:hypothetical protein [Microcoleus sp. FACHB-672]MBD2040027.1 hypothetical protein [Microcoleus sp. FACHB-672]